MELTCCNGVTETQNTKLRSYFTRVISEAATNSRKEIFCYWATKNLALYFDDRKPKNVVGSKKMYIDTKAT